MLHIETQMLKFFLLLLIKLLHACAGSVTGEHRFVREMTMPDSEFRDQE